LNKETISLKGSKDPGSGHCDSASGVMPDDLRGEIGCPDDTQYLSPRVHGTTIDHELISLIWSKGGFHF